MSGSLTVIGGHTGSAYTGLVTVPAGFVGSLDTALQSVLTADSNSVLGGGSFFNFNVAGLTGDQTVPAGGPNGLLELTNTDSVGATTAGATAISVTVPAGYTSLIVQAPGAETVTGNGADSSFALFGGASSVHYTDSGSGSVFASGNDNLLLTGSAFSVVGGTVGGNVFALLSDTDAVTTEGGSNVIFVAGQADTVLSGGSNDVIASASDSGSITVSGFANYIGTAGSNTVTAIGTATVSAFIDKGYAGSLDFINNSSAASTVTGLAGSVTVFGGVGGGHYEGGSQGGNSLVGGSGLVTLVGSSSGNDTLIAQGGGGGGINILNAGDFDSTGGITTGGNDTLMSTSTAGSTFFTTNAGVDQVSASGSGTQYFQLNAAGIATVTGTSNGVNQFFLTQSSAGGGTNDLLKNFSLSRDNFLITNSPGTFISTVDGSGTVNLGSGLHGSTVTLSNGSTIKLVGVSFSNTQVASITGGSSF